MERPWIKAYVKGVPAEIRFEEMSLPEALRRSADRFPDNPALFFQGTTITFRDLDGMVSKFAVALIQQGLKPGEKVSIILPNIVQTVVAIYGVLRAGGIAVMHNPRSDDMQLEHQINKAGSQNAVCLDVLVPRIIRLRGKTSLVSIVSCHIRDYLPFLKKQLFPLFKKQLHLKTKDEGNVIEFTELMQVEAQIPRFLKPNLDDTAFILFTSATTGKSKGVELSHGNMSKNVQQLHAWFPSFMDGEEIVVGCVPFFHVFGLTCSLNIGIFYGYADILVPVPEPKAILEAIHNYKATFIPALPSFYTGMLNEKSFRKYNLRSLSGCFSGGAPMPMELIKEFEEATGAQICEGYGLTESAPTTHINPFGGRTKSGTIGLPLPNTDAKLVSVNDFNEEIVEPGIPGELCIKGPQIMKGYINDAAKTEETLKEGWLLTGDIAIVDSEGYFKIVDRKKDLIANNGKIIYPRDIDEILFQHPHVLEACALGVPNLGNEDEIKAFVVLKKGAIASPVEIIDFCRKHLPNNAVPRSIEFLDELPKSAVGKILRKELRRLHLIHSAQRKVTRV